METSANRGSVGVGEGGTAWDLRDVGENRRAVARRHDLLGAFLSFSAKPQDFFVKKFLFLNLPG